MEKATICTSLHLHMGHKFILITIVGNIVTNYAVYVAVKISFPHYS